MGTRAVIWADMEAWAVDYLARCLFLAEPEHPEAVDVMVRNRVPTERQGDDWPASQRLVVCRDDGGQWQGDVRAEVRMGFQVWAETHEVATDLARLLTAYLGAAEGDGPIRRASPARAYTVSDEEGRPKRYLTAQFTIRGDQLDAPLPAPPE